MDYSSRSNIIIDILNLANLPHDHINDFPENTGDLAIQTKELLILYAGSLQIPKRNLEHIKNRILFHLSFFKKQLLHHMNLESYYELTESILVIYCRIELLMLLRDQSHKDDITNLICLTSEKILTALKKNFNRREKYVLKVLLKVSRKYRDKRSCSVFRILFCQVFNIYPLNYVFAESFSRRYIIFMKIIEHIPYQEEFIPSARVKCPKRQFFTDNIMDFIFSVNNRKALRFQNTIFSSFSAIQNTFHKESSDQPFMSHVKVSPIDDDAVPKIAIMKDLVFPNVLMNLNIVVLPSKNDWILMKSINKLLAIKAMGCKPYILNNKSKKTNILDADTSEAQINTPSIVTATSKYIKDSINGFELQEMDVSIDGILDDKNILKGCALRNVEIIQSVTVVPVLRKLFKAVLIKSDLDFKETHNAFQIICSIVPLIRDYIIDKVLDILNEFISPKNAPLDPLLASRYSIIMTLLVVMNNNEDWHTYNFQCNIVLDKILSHSFVTGLLFHIQTAAIKDLLLVLMTEVYMNQRINIFFNSLDLIQSLVRMLNPKCGREKIDSAAELLYEFNQIACVNRRTQEKEHKTDVLLVTMESPSTISLVLNTILTKPRCESSLTAGLKVLNSILNYEKSDDLRYYYPRSYNSAKCPMLPAQKYIEMKYIKTVVVQVFTERLSEFHGIMRIPPKKNQIATTVGVLMLPLGKTRMEIIKLLVTLIKIDNKHTTEVLVRLRICKTILDLFFRYPLNNLFHVEVYHLILAAFETFDACSPEGSMAMHLLIDCRLVQRIHMVLLDVNTTDARSGPRYIGPLVKIAYVVAEYCRPNKPMSKILRQKAPKTFNLLHYLKVEPLRDIVNTYMIPLGSNSDDSEEETD